jgi:hypothetical protein
MVAKKSFFLSLYRYIVFIVDLVVISKKAQKRADLYIATWQNTISRSLPHGACFFGGHENRNYNI